MSTKTEEEEIVSMIKTLARGAARRMRSSGLSEEDFFQEGYIAYMKAKDRFDPNNGASFKTFIAIRVRGAMIDATRSFYWLGYSAAKTRGKILRSSPDDISAFPTVENETIDTQLKDISKQDEFLKFIDDNDIVDFVCKGLKEDEKDIFIKHYIYNIPCSTICKEYDVVERSLSARLKNTILPYVSKRAELYFSKQSPKA